MTSATATEIVMPRLSDSMEEGTILSWLVDAGAPVTAGEDLLEVETDKANMTVEAEASGKLEILVGEGETVAVGTRIALVGDGPTGDGPTGDATPPSPAPASRSDDVGTRRITPLARRMAEDHGVAIASIGSGSGIGGRIVKADVLAAAGIEAPAPSPEPAGRDEPASIETAKGAGGTTALTRLQAVIARRMAEAKATVPHFQVETEVRMDAAVELRRQLKEAAGDEPAPSFNDMIVRAAAVALRAHPKANGSYKEGAFELHERVNVGIAVAADDALVVPTIFDADRKSLGEIGRDARRLAGRVRNGEVTPPELAGGTFTVSNLGMFGMTAIYPVINPPQAAILGVGRSRPVLRRDEEGQIVDSALMTLTLSCDHRILYGAEAAEFLAAIRDLLEVPLRIAF